ncbi:hypothetical protein BDV28DRAFT_143076 [Aspergillus coremiiformis]|uniref:Uncharacterized protein n=1 Tax=Aspergillus coremiiformis TaxID=138285 RepID=A0A5N6YT07_9EURO|nr:hypothetical protein BDV28DRAFT_143076 [Aspergillus coremiiformis]
MNSMVLYLHRLRSMLMNLIKAWPCPRGILSFWTVFSPATLHTMYSTPYIHDYAIHLTFDKPQPVITRVLVIRPVCTSKRQSNPNR